MINFDAGITQSGDYLQIVIDGYKCNIAENSHPSEWNAVQKWLKDHPKYTIEQGKTAEPSSEEKRIHARAYRDRLLRHEIDCYNAIRWESMTETERQAVREYRQALCDWPESVGFPDLATIPTAPEA